jgi:long-subunit fatty acid transport protein
MFGVRRNFVQANWRVVPYVPWAQGQDLTFNFILGGGVRYNFNPRYSISTGIAYMHVSNAYLSQPKVTDHGMNVYGPTFGVNVGLGRLR